MSGRRRGFETALDMLRTLAVVFALVLPMWFFGRSSPQDEQRIRAVDPSGAYSAFVQDTGGPTVTRTPDGWTVTVRDLATTPGVVRVGYVVGDHYLEFLGSGSADFLADATGRASVVGTVLVNGVSWQDYRSDAGAQSLVLDRAGVKVVIGGVRETASQAELEQLAALVA